MIKKKVFTLFSVAALVFLFIFAASGKMYGDDGPPYGSLLKAGTTFYGMTRFDGTEDSGTIFKIGIDGSGYHLLHSFTVAQDGGNPPGKLILSGTTLYGMAPAGGAYGGGTIFKIETDGSGFQVLHHFAGGADDGWGPEDSLVMGGTTLYGTTMFGGDYNLGTVFKIESDGSGFALLREFRAGPFGQGEPHTPMGTLIIDGTTLYGTTAKNGSRPRGNACTVFRLETDGSGFKRLLSFRNPFSGVRPFRGSLLRVGTTLYGMCITENNLNQGIVFKVGTDGSGAAILHQFTGGPDNGDSPYDCTLFKSGDYLYGMTFGGGDYDNGVVFEIKADGGGFALIHEFNAGERHLGAQVHDGILYYGVSSENGITISAKEVPLHPELTLTTPNGGEEWIRGDVQHITWSAFDIFTPLKITLWKGGQLVGNIAENIAPASNSYAWQVGQYNGGTVQEGTDYTIEIEETGSDLVDGSDAAFTIIVTNEAPVAVCKNIEIPVDSNCQATITADDVDGGSYDPDEDDEITLSLDNSGPFGVGQYNVKLTVEDLEGESDYCYATVTVVDNTPPVPDMAELPIVSGECSATITVFPTATDNCAGIIQGITTDPLTYTGQGTYTVTWIFDDGRGNTASQTQTVVVQDTTAPTIANIASSHVLLWPPNHQMVPVTITVDAADNCDAAPVSKITKVESNEPVNGLGDGDTSPDWEITGDLTVNLRAERSGRGKGIGRIYTITVECSDAVGNVSAGSVTVIVPKNKKKK